MSPTTVTVVVSISLALLGYIVTYSNSLRLDRRKDRLMRLDKQLRGPRSTTLPGRT
jgi:hypothetical protein